MSYEEEDTCHMRRRIHTYNTDLLQGVAHLGIEDHDGPIVSGHTYMYAFLCK